MTDNEFADTYRITATRSGRIFGYRDMFRIAFARVSTSPLPGMREASLGVLRKHVEAVMADERFMRFHTGMISQRVSEAIEEKVWERIRG